ncbi:MAG TPA: hypothetical protein VH682_21290 [Gemmataceae bacterium]
MSSRILLCISAISAILFLCGSIKIREERPQSMEIGRVGVPGKWKVSSPTVQSNDGKYLAYEAAGKSPRVYFTKEKGPHTIWAFVEMKPFTEHSLAHTKGISVDASGFTLRLRATEGPFRGWYLTRTKEGELVLTKEPRRASEVRLLMKRTESRFR